MPTALFSYPGSKRREVPIIEKYMPAQWTTFVDVFGGGGNVVFSQLKDKTKVYIYNDVDPKLADIYASVLDPVLLDKFDEELKAIVMTKDNNNLLMNNRLTLSPRCEFLYKGVVSYMGLRHTKLVDTTRVIKEESLSDKFKIRAYAKQFEGYNVQVMNDDYSTIFDLYNELKNIPLYYRRV